MATKAEQIEIFRGRFMTYMWDLSHGNKTTEQIHSALKADARELLATPPTRDDDTCEIDHFSDFFTEND